MAQKETEVQGDEESVDVGRHHNLKCEASAIQVPVEVHDILYVLCLVQLVLVDISQDTTELSEVELVAEKPAESDHLQLVEGSHILGLCLLCLDEARLDWT